MKTSTYVVNIEETPEFQERLINFLTKYGEEKKVSGSYFELTDVASQKVMQIVKIK